MPTFVYVIEDISPLAVGANVTLNEILDSLQKKGATILDVKVSSTIDDSMGQRTFLIIYKATKPIEV